MAATKRLISELGSSSDDPDSGFSSSSGGNSPPESKTDKFETDPKSDPRSKSEKYEPEAKLSRLDSVETSSVRTSLRVQKLRAEERKEIAANNEASSENTAEIPNANGENSTENGDLSKQKRAWEQWSSEDKALFFEALNECGKNFEAIQVFFQTRQKKKSALVARNKDQIRTFYYRTWHKICKYVDFTEEYQNLKKSSRELYALINFGELRKRLGSQLDDKTGVKLRELIFKGHTTVRIKGKSHRLRTPTCQALKKLSETIKLEDYSSANVPSKVNLILTPLNTNDFDKVHRLALSNPHVSISVRPGRSLNSVFDFLKNRWKKIVQDDLDNNFYIGKNVRFLIRNALMISC